MMYLGKYTTIRTGLVFSRLEQEPALEAIAGGSGTREKALPDRSSYKYRALNLKTITEHGQILLTEVIDYFSKKPLKGEYFTHTGDLLLRLSAPYTSVVIKENETDLLVPSHFAIIRANTEIDPYYLNWWLESNRKLFYKFASGGTMMGTLSSGYVAEMQFDPPPLEKQQKIGEMLKLANREQQLLSSLKTKKKLLINTTLNTVINKGEKTQ
jgi:restriction endonuclease S subunit